MKTEETKEKNQALPFQYDHPSFDWGEHVTGIREAAHFTVVSPSCINRWITQRMLVPGVDVDLQAPRRFGRKRYVFTKSGLVRCWDEENPQPSGWGSDHYR